METPNRRFLTTALLLATVVLPTTSDAQRVAATFGAGIIGGADAPAADFATPVYTVSVQRVMKTYFVLDGELVHWTHTWRHERAPHEMSGLAGLEGHVSRTTVVSAHKMWNVGLNFLVRSTGAVRVFGGGGASLSTDDSEYSQQSFDCSPSLDPRVCSRFVNARIRGPIPLFRALGGVEVPLTTKLGIFGALRAEASAWEDRRNVISGIAGVRFFLE
jgi:hypothetical protein